MICWIALTSVDVTAGPLLLHSLAEALPAEVAFREIRLADAPEGRDEVLAALAQERRGGELAGLIAFDPGTLPLLALADPGLRRLYAPVGLPAPPAEAGARGILDRVSTLISAEGAGLELCLPQATAAIAAAAIAVPGRVIVAPAPFRARAPRTAERRLALEFAFPADGPALRRFLDAWAAATPKAGSPHPANSALFLLPEAARREMWDLADEPGRFELMAVEAVPGASNLGAAALILPASALTRCEEAARIALMSGAALLVWPGPAEAPGQIVVLDTAGQPHDLLDLVAEPTRVEALARAFVTSTEAARAAALDAWRVMLTSRQHPGGQGLPLLFPRATQEAAIATMPAAGRLATRLLLDPTEAAALLELAEQLVDAGDAVLGWRAVSLARQVALATGRGPAMPAALAARQSRGLAYVTEAGGDATGRASLSSWLASLPATRGSAALPGRPAAPPANLSGGLGRLSDGARVVSSAGCFVVLGIPDPPLSPDIEELQLRLRLRLGSRARPQDLAVRWNGGPVRGYLRSETDAVSMTARLPAPGNATTGLLELYPAEDGAVVEDVALEDANLAYEPAAIAELTEFTIDLLIGADSDTVGAGAYRPEFLPEPRRGISDRVVIILPRRIGKDASTAWLLLDLAPPSDVDAAALTPALLDGDRKIPFVTLGASAGRHWCGVPLPASAATAVIEFGGALTPVITDGALRFLAAWLHRIAIAHSACDMPDLPAAVHIPLAETEAPLAGWFQAESFAGLSCRWMSRAATVTVRGRAPGTALRHVVIAGPMLPGREQPEAISVSLNGRPGSLTGRSAATDVWAHLYTIQPDDGLSGFGFATTIEFTAPAVELSSSDPRIASVLVSAVWLLDPTSGIPVESPLGAALVPPNTWQWEHWGAGLEGCWLPEETVLIVLRPPHATRIVIEGAAATGRSAVKALGAVLDGVALALDSAMAPDGSWQASAALEAPGEDGAGHLLALRCPTRGSEEGPAQRLMLRKVSFA